MYYYSVGLPLSLLSLAGAKYPPKNHELVITSKIIIYDATKRLELAEHGYGLVGQY